jgi:hypothetical protein
MPVDFFAERASRSMKRFADPVIDFMIAPAAAIGGRCRAMET